MKKILYLVCICAVMMVTGCSSPKKVPYMIDAETIPADVLAQVNPISDPVAMPGDLLNIEVSATNMTAVLPFNKGRYVDADGRVADSNNNNTSSDRNSTRYYLVSTDGDIDFPIIGKLHVGGMDKSRIEALVKSKLYPQYLREEPAVDIRFMNFRVTMLGAVRSPGVIISDNERLNVLEAIAKAGDLDIKGQRENILLIRTHSDGSREIARLNLNDKNILSSPYFNLQQNDILYVQPNKSAANNSWQLNPAVDATLTVVGGLSSIIGLALSIITLTRL